MDFVERPFGFSHDEDSGTFELLLIAVPFTIGAAMWARRERRLRKRLTTASRIR
jgi:hypothetical protein